MNRAGPTWRTVPNLVTAIRFVLVVPVVWLLLSGAQPLGAAVLAAVFGMTDWVDGFLARRLDQASRLGKVLDPLADRVGIGCIAIALAFAGAAPWAVIAVFPVVDMVVGGLYLARRRDARLEVGRLGKVRTGVTMAAIFVLMLGMRPGFDVVLQLGRIGLAVGAALHIGAGSGYARRMLPCGARRGPLGRESIACPGGAGAAGASPTTAARPPKS